MVFSTVSLISITSRQGQRSEKDYEMNSPENLEDAYWIY